MARKYIKLHYDFFQITETLSDASVGRLIRAMLIYAQTGESPVVKGMERYVYPVFRAQLDRDIQSYNAIVENGRKGGAPRGNTNARKTAAQAETEPAVRECVRETRREESEPPYAEAEPVEAEGLVVPPEEYPWGRCAKPQARETAEAFAKARDALMQAAARDDADMAFTGCKGLGGVLNTFLTG